MLAYPTAVRRRLLKSLFLTGLMVFAVVLGAACADTEPTAVARSDQAAAPTAIPTLTLTSTPTPTPTPTPEPTTTPALPPLTARQLIVDSAIAMQAVDSFHFEIDATATIDADGGSLEIPIVLEGDFDGPDSLRGSVTVTVIFFTIETEFVTIGDTVYVTDPETGEWKVTVGDPGFFALPGEFAGSDATELAEELLDIALVALMPVDGVETYFLQGTVPSELLGQPGDVASIAYWIGVDDGLPRQIEAEFALDLAAEAADIFGDFGEGAAALRLTVKFTDFGKPVSITAPDVEDTATPLGAESESGGVSGPEISEGAAGSLLQRAYEGLPDTFVSQDPVEAGVGIAALGAEDLFTEIAVFVSDDPFETIYVLTGELDPFFGAVIDLTMESPDLLLEQFRLGFLLGGEGSVAVADSGVLKLPRFGDKSVSVFVVVEAEGAQIRQEVVQFRQGDTLGMVVTMHRPGEAPAVSVQEAAELLVAEIAADVAPEQ